MYCFENQVKQITFPVSDVDLMDCNKICKSTPQCDSITYEGGTCLLLLGFVPSSTTFCTKQMLGGESFVVK